MFRRWKRIEEKLDRLLALMEDNLMATLADIITALNDNTNAVATRMDALLAEIAAAGAAPTQAQLDSLQAISDHLKQLGANPANPVPPAFPAGSPNAAAALAAASTQGPTPSAAALNTPVPASTTPTSTAPADGSLATSSAGAGSLPTP